MRPFELIPPVKDYIWGGTKLRELYGKDPAAVLLQAFAEAGRDRQ